MGKWQFWPQLAEEIETFKRVRVRAHPEELIPQHYLEPAAFGDAWSGQITLPEPGESPGGERLYINDFSVLSLCSSNANKIHLFMGRYHGLPIFTRVLASIT